jgi:chromosome segregation ATPase
MEAKEKVRPLHAEQKSETKEKEPQKSPEQLLAETRKDMGKVGLFVSILAVVLVVVFFYGINQDVSVLQEDVEELATLQSEVNGLEGQVSSIEDSVSGLNNDINGLSGKFSNLSGSFDKMDTQVVRLQDRFSQLNGKVGTMGQKLAELENLPETTRAMILINIIEEMSRQANYLSNQVEGEQQRSLMEAKKLLDQVQQGLAK